MAKLKELTPEDLARWRVASVDKELVSLAFPGMSVEEARRALLTHYKVLNDLLLDYEINSEDNGVYISPIDGGIYRVSMMEGFGSE